MEIVKAFASNDMNMNITIKGTTEEPLFRASDIGEILEMTNINVSLQHFNETEKVSVIIKTNGGPQTVSFLTEKGLYKVLFRSRKPIAEQFQNWVCDIVKEIRLTGEYQLRQQIQETETRLQAAEAENVQMTIERNQLLEETAKLSIIEHPIIYIYNLDVRVTPPELKIGYTLNVHKRIKPFKQVLKYGKLEHSVEIQTTNIRTVENYIHLLLSRFLIKDEVFRLDVNVAISIVQQIVNLFKTIAINNDSERQLKITKLYESTENIMNNSSMPKISTNTISTQTDFYENTFVAQPVLLDNNDHTAKFEQYIQEHCIVRSDVEVSTTDIIGQYRILHKVATKEITTALKFYLDTRFKQSRLQVQNEKNVTNGYIGVKLKDIKYTRNIINSDMQQFVYHACTFAPSGKVLFSNLSEEYAKWKISLNKPVTANDNDELKKYLKTTNYVLYTTIWTETGNGQGYYGLFLKNQMNVSRTSSTSKKVYKRDATTHNILGTWDSIAKAAESEKVCAAKMSRCIKNGTIVDDDYYYCLPNAPIPSDN
jgi:prophage antirepressor-like protein